MPVRRLALATALTLTGCANYAPATIEGECRLMRPAPHVITTETPTGQAWADKTIETGVRVCGHPRPPRR